MCALLPLFLLSCADTENAGKTASTNGAGAYLVAPTNAALAAPADVHAYAGNGEVTLTWAAVTGATSYNIYYLTHYGVTIGNAKQRTLAISKEPITGLANGVTYYFRVTALNDAGESVASSEVWATPMRQLPGIPGDVQLDQLLYGGVASATVKWQKVPYATSYNLYYGTSPGLTPASPNKITGIVLTSETVRGLTAAPGHYYFMVTAVNESGESAPSVELVATAKSAYKALAAGYGHSVALRNIDMLPIDAGTVWEWGNNSSGQLGTDGASLENHTAVTTKVISRATSIAAGYDHTVALTTDNSVHDWGLNSTGQLGYSFSITNSKLPITADAPYDMKAIAAGSYHTIALKNDGTVWTWGYNDLGQLGRASWSCLDPHNQNQNAGYTCDSSPAKVPGITGVVTAIAAGDLHTLAVDNAGTVWAWGRNDTGQLGNTSYCPDSIMAATPEDIGFSTDTRSSCGIYPIQLNSIPAYVIAVTAGTRHSVALTSDGNVWTWGGDYYGQLGQLTAPAQECQITSAFKMQCTVNPGQVQGLDHVIAISSGSYHTLALKSDGTVWTWGYNLSNKEIKDSINPNAGTNRVPVMVPGLSGITAIAAGAFHSLALKNDGTVWAWGYNGHGQLGDGTTTDRLTPVKVQGLLGPVVIIPGL